MIRLIFATCCLSLLTLACSKKKEEPRPLVPRTVDQDPSLPSVLINGRLLHSEAFGQAGNTLIVCLHGGPGADYRYLLNAKDLADYGYSVVFYDQVGSGLSQRFEEEYYKKLSIEQIFVNELRGIIAKYKTKPNQKVILLGHSWGAILATYYAGKYPNEIEGLALFEPGGLVWEDIVSYVLKSQAPCQGMASARGMEHSGLVSDQSDSQELLDYQMALSAGAVNCNTGESLIEGDFWRMGAVVASAAFEQGEKNKPDLSVGIGQFSKPVLFGYGDNKAYPDSWAQKVSSVFINKQLFKVSDVGHSGMFTNRSVWTNTTLPQLLNYFSLLQKHW